MIGNSEVFSKKSGSVSPAFGIDLGTTNSAISIMKSGGLSEIIPLRNGDHTMPSCVMYTSKDEKPVVGKEAYMKRHLPNVVYSVKRLMGTDQNIQINCDGKKWTVTPVEVSAEILKELVYQISDRYKEVKDVVITVPADFNDTQVRDTKEAGKLAGLNVIGILREPTAASLAFDLEEKINGDVLVYDLGGGTFDATLVSITGGKTSNEVKSFDPYGFDEPSEEKDSKLNYVVKATRGDSHLGGDDFDKEMYNILCKKLRVMGVDPSLIPDVYREELILRLEKLKKESVMGTFTMTIDYTPKGRNKKPVNVEVTINHNDFFQATNVIFNKSKALVDELLRSYSGKLGAIILVGGSTKNVFIKKLLECYGVRVYTELNPDEAVALGAGVQARNIKFGDSNITVLDVLSHGIGVLADGRILNLIPRDSMVPTSTTKVFATTVDNQKEIQVEIYSGNSYIAEDCVCLGTLNVENNEMGPAGTVGVIVKLSVDSDGLLECAVKVGDQFKEVKLKNVFGREIKNNKTLDRKTKQCSRWRTLATTLDEKLQKELESLVDDYENGKVSEEDILSFIRINIKKENRFTNRNLRTTIEVEREY